MSLPLISTNCTNCGTAINKAPTRSFLGFQKLTCPTCQTIFNYPLTGGYRVVTWFLLVFSFFYGMPYLEQAIKIFKTTHDSTLRADAIGQLIIPALLFFGFAYSLFKDYKLQKKYSIVQKID